MNEIIIINRTCSVAITFFFIKPHEQCVFQYKQNPCRFRLLPHFFIHTFFLSLEWLECRISEARPMYDTFMAKLWILDWTLFDTWRRVHPWTLTQDRPSSPQQEPWSGYCWQRKAQRRARSCGARQENRPPFGFLWGGMGVVVLARADGSGEVGSLATSSWPADPLPHQDSDSGRSEIWWNE